MGNKARQTIIEKFTWEEIARRFEKMYYEFRKKDKKNGNNPKK
jgi:hypothetical protein